MSNHTRGPVLVTGATGRQGGATARHLLERGWPVRAFTRNPDTPAARALAERGAEVVQGDYNDPASLTRAVEGVHGVFSLQDWWVAGLDGEVRQGRALAEAAKQVEVKHFVYTSVGGAERATGVPHFETKWVLEQYIRKLHLPATFLRPVSFMENYYMPQVEKGILKGRFLDGVRADKPYQLIAVDDIGAFAAAVFDRGDEMIGQAIEIAGDELTNLEIAATFTRVMGRPVKFMRIPLLMIRLGGGPDVALMYKWFNRHGYEADIPRLKERFPEVRLTSLEDWIRREGWAEKTIYQPHAKTWKPKKAVASRKTQD
ncbi:MAG: NmrA/HSCARG family protein [Gemmatimonadales bacterium]|nr:NmrA/HSCARG family protein [Gemmatimonadales bacterium]